MARILKNWLESYLEYTSHSESPEQFHYWTGVSVIAGALRRKVWLDMGYFQWSPNFFIFLIAPPAIVSKSTSANIGTKLLYQIEEIKFGPSSVTWQAILDSFLAAAQCYPLDDDPMGFKMDMSCITIVASELGTFLDPRNREMVDLLNDMWDGKDIPFVRLTRGEGETRINNPWINMLACTTPAWIAENVNNQFAAGGFASRSIFVFAEVKRRLVAYPFLEIDNEQAGREANLVKDLTEISLLRGPFKLTPAAITWGTKWYSDHYEQHALMSDIRYRGHIDRKQTHLHKLAMVISAAQRGDMFITSEDLQEAARRLTSLEKDIPRVFSSMNKEELADMSGDAVQALQQLGTVTIPELFRRAFMKRVSYETFKKVIDSVVGAGLVIQIVRGTSIYLELNQALLKETADSLKRDRSS